LFWLWLVPFTGFSFPAEELCEAGCEEELPLICGVGTVCWANTETDPLNGAARKTIRLMAIS
jgi:hypothetical protein